MFCFLLILQHCFLIAIIFWGKLLNPSLPWFPCLWNGSEYYRLVGLSGLNAGKCIGCPGTWHSPELVVVLLALICKSPIFHRLSHLRVSLEYWLVNCLKLWRRQYFTWFEYQLRSSKSEKVKHVRMWLHSLVAWTSHKLSNSEKCDFMLLCS